MSASDLRKIEELESKIQEFQRRQVNQLKVQITEITGHGGNRLYGETSLIAGRPVSNDCWSVDPHHYNNPCICPFDEESMKQLQILIGGNVVPQEFFSFRAALEHYGLLSHLLGDGNEPFALSFEIGPPPPSDYDDRNKIPIHTVYARLGLAASSSTSMVDKIKFVSLIKSFQDVQEKVFQLDQLLRHFGTLINTNDERGGGGTKLAMTIERIVFRKNFISGGMSLLNEIGIQTNPPAAHRG